MTPHRAKELLPIFTAFAQGKIIQLQLSNGSWQDIHKPDFSGAFYRVKPDPIFIKYRRYIWKDDNGWHIASFSHDSDIAARDVENMPRFVRWIDNDWVTYECEV